MSVSTLFYEETEEQGVEFVDDYFLENVEELAVGYLQDFFANKQLHCGGRISPNIFKSAACIDRALNTSIEEGVPLAYELIEREGIKGGVQLVLGVLNRCSQLGIPKCFRAGILLVNLELCYGVVI
ncbi:MAG: hypothetical protein M0R80_01675 [Proteobacteria bacterium]|jgi:hypothetical protein|nr:hypothetical protein [Pseudomonadota bacterium]